jgi:hypothetical protein
MERDKSQIRRCAISKQTFPSCAMNDIATDVAAALQTEVQTILPRSVPAAR